MKSLSRGIGSMNYYIVLKFDITILNTNLAASRFHEIIKYGPNIAHDVLLISYTARPNLAHDVFLILPPFVIPCP